MAKCKILNRDPSRKSKSRARNGEPAAFLALAISHNEPGCLFWPYGRNTHGVAMMWVSGEMRIVPRLVCEAANGEPPTPDHEAAHNCGNGHLACVSAIHLEWKTRAGNMADMVAHGTSLRGSRSPNAKLSESSVRQILALKGEMLQREIAVLFGVTRTTVSLIHRKVRWAWLT